MAQWGQQSYQYPMPTGYNPQQFQQGFQSSGGLAPQPAGFPAQQPAGYQQPQPTGYQPQQPAGFQQQQPTGFPGASSFQQPQQTGFPGQQGQLLPQQTGYVGASGFQQRAPPPPPPVPPIPSQFQQNVGQQNSGYLGVQPTGRFGSASPLQAQPTGYAGGGGLRPLVPQMTGFVDPRLQMMSTTFMPMNTTMPYNPAGAPQLPSAQLGGMSLQQNFQQHNQAQRGSATPKVPWALSKAEKKQYDQIFRAWDVQGTGFINGQTALEVFGQSGLDKNNLAKIWALADADNRGKLNLAEFHVAMGLIYRCLNGNEIPDELPQEMVPPSHRDLDASVTLLKDILKNDTRARSPSNIDTPVSRMKERSFNSTGAPGAGGRQDATVYKYKDESPPGGFYQPRSRHIDRSAVRTASDADSPASDLDEMKRQLENTAKMLDRAAEDNASRSAEDEALDREMEELRYRVNRVKDDLDYVSRGPRSQAKDEDRRRLERELLKLMHERIPEVERKIKDREERRAREKREWARDRDRRNDRFGRYDDREDRYSSRYDDGNRDRPYRDVRDRDYDDRPYSRNERDRDYNRDYERDQARDYDRARSPPAALSPPPAPPSAPPPSALAKPPPPAPIPAKSPAPNLRNMSEEERKAFIRAEAQRRMQERMAALGVAPAGSTSPKLDTSVEDRLALEKKEAEEKARVAEKEAEERERVRRERLESEKALKGTPSPAPPTPSTSAPAPLPPPSAQTPTPKPTPPPVKSRAPAPPPPRKGFAPKPPAPKVRTSPAVPTPTVSSPVPPTPPTPSVPQEDPEEAALKAREEAVRKQRERLERLRQLEREEEEARRAEEEYQARRRAFEAKAVASPPAVSTPLASPPAPIPPPVVSEVSAPFASPPPPPPPPPAPVTPASDRSTTNPFSRIMKESPAAIPTTPSANGSTNPFFKNQAASPPAEIASPPPPAASAVSAPPRAPSAPPPSKSPAPPAIKTSYHTAPAGDDEDWDDVQEKDDDDSSDDEINSSRDSRNKLAQQLFGNILPPSRPQSAAAASMPSPRTPTFPQTSSPAPPTAPPPPASAPPAPTSDGIPAAPPPPPMAPAAPPPPAVAAPAPSGDRSALLNAIQLGKPLKKTQTHDRSATGLAGKVLGDTAPPPHINAAPRAPSPPAQEATAPARYEEHADLSEAPRTSARSSNRESVDWYAGLAADSGSAPPNVSPLPSMAEEEEPATPVPAIQVDSAENDAMADVDKSIEYRVRSLYPYEGQRPEDLSFAENLVMTAHPSKSGGDWWYGTLLRDGKAGFFPKTYVDKIESVKARALYSYEGNSPDELPFAEGDELTIVDRSEADWWKAEREGVLFIVPAGYLEIEVFLVFSTYVSHHLRFGNDKISIAAAAASSSVSAASVAEKPLLQPPTDEERHDGRGAEPNPTNLPDKPAHEEDADDTQDDLSDTDSEYLSLSSESDADDTNENPTEEARNAERKARALERQRVLEAAGFIIKEDVKPPPRPPRPRKERKRRPPPAVPARQHAGAHSRDISTDVGVGVSVEADKSLRLDDAFERYETYRKANPKMNRLSLASIESSASVVPSSSTLSLGASAIQRSGSAEPEGRGALHFLSIFGRKTPANDGETRTMPVISSPISRDGSASGLEGDNAFGSTWASLVDNSVLEDIPAKERRRQEAIFELVLTEAAYVRDLQLMVEHFYAKLISVLEDKAVQVIFANVEDILLVNTTFLSVLEDRQKECRLYIDSIGDILHRGMSEMGVYVEYCVNQAYAAKVLQSEREVKPELEQLLIRLRDDPTARNLDLSSYLLVPMQRITRYPLLIRQVLHYTEVSDDRKHIEHALDVAGRILSHINETIREQEGQERLREISKDLWIGQGRLDLTAPTRYMGPRKLLKEGVLMKAKSGRRLRAFLCTDILVLTQDQAKQLYRTPIPLSEVRVQEVPGRRDDLSFQISIAYPRGGDAIVVRASSARDCQVWMQAIQKASAVCRDAEQRARGY